MWAGYVWQALFSVVAATTKFTEWIVVGKLRSSYPLESAWSPGFRLEIQESFPYLPRSGVGWGARALRRLGRCGAFMDVLSVCDSVPEPCACRPSYWSVYVG